MSITVVTTLHCEHEGCKETTSSSKQAKPSPRNLRACAKDIGWSRVGGKDYCESHKPIYKRVLVPAS